MTWAVSLGLTGVLRAQTPAPASAAPTRLLFIHGRGQGGSDPVKLKQDWIDALNKGGAAQHQSLPATVQVAFPFYGDVLDRYAAAQRIPLVSDVASRGGEAPNADYEAFQQEFAEELREKAGISDAAVQAELETAPQERGPLNWKWVHAILRVLDKNSKWVGQESLEQFTRDVYLYTRLPGVRDDIDALVGAQLTTDPTVVVAHSLGTIVAYSILKTDRRVLQIPELVTLGSPLGVRAVRDQFRPLRSPACIQAWYNAFDTRDVVALYPLDKDNFPISPPIENNPRVKNFTDNRHGIAGYLGEATVADRILSKFGPGH